MSKQYIQREEGEKGIHKIKDHLSDCIAVFVFLLSIYWISMY